MIIPFLTTNNWRRVTHKTNFTVLSVDQRLWIYDAKLFYQQNQVILFICILFSFPLSTFFCLMYHQTALFGINTNIDKQKPKQSISNMLAKSIFIFAFSAFLTNDGIESPLPWCHIQFFSYTTTTINFLHSLFWQILTKYDVFVNMAIWVHILYILGAIIPAMHF